MLHRRNTAVELWRQSEKIYIGQKMYAASIECTKTCSFWLTLIGWPTIQLVCVSKVSECNHSFKKRQYQKLALFHLWDGPQRAISNQQIGAKTITYLYVDVTTQNLHLSSIIERKSNTNRSTGPYRPLWISVAISRNYDVLLLRTRLRNLQTLL